MDMPTFLRLFQMRRGQVMWFLGAGASRAAGIKTATDMIWEFKQQIYCSEKKRSLSSIPDVGDAAVRRKLQLHFDAKQDWPSVDSPEEYAFYFEKTYPSPKDRRAYIDAQIARGKPSFGHFGLGLLMKHGGCHLVWTTNFDRTVEDAAFKVLGGSGHLVIGDLGEPAKLNDAITEMRWPILGKLHGDYHSSRLKNTASELQAQDADMRRALVASCKQRGLAVVGYSGRDSSIMNALEEAIDSGRGFPGGLFWFKRFQDAPFAAVGNLLERARASGIEAHVVEVETFDELISDALRFIPETEHEAKTIADATRPRLDKVSSRVASSLTPAIRTNALPVTSYPAVCRLVICQVAGQDDVNDLVAKADADIDAFRIRDGVAAFGRDSEIRRAFEGRNLTALETHAISPGQLVAPTGTQHLIRAALFRAIAKRPALTALRDGGKLLILPDPTLITAALFNSSTSRAVDRVAGALGRVSWSEACSIRLDHRLDRLWLLLEPRVHLELPEDATEQETEAAFDFRRERRARRRNKETNAMLDGWTKLLVGEGASVRLKAFGISDGYDAEFEIVRVAGFSGACK
jgi:hypothetical protein